MSELRVSESDLKLSGFDGGGGPIWQYENKPFTGVLVCYEKDGTLAYEQECKDGYEDGWYRAYFPNGQLEKAYEQLHNVVVANTYKKWDENGNLLEEWGSLDSE